MKTELLDQFYGYRVDSHGNGVAVTITRESDNASRFIQGDEAALFLDEWNDLSIDHNSPETRASRFSWRELLDTMCGPYFD